MTATIHTLPVRETERASDIVNVALVECIRDTAEKLTIINSNFRDVFVDVKQTGDLYTDHLIKETQETLQAIVEVSQRLERKARNAPRTGGDAA